MRSLFGDEVSPFLGACSADHDEAGSAGDLHGGNSHSATGSMYQHALSRTNIRSLKQSSIGGRIGNINRGALRVRESIREGLHDVLPAQRSFRIGAADRTRRIDTRAHLPSADPVPNRLYNSGGIRAWGVGERGFSCIGPAADIGIDGIDAGGMNPHHDLPRARLWIGTSSRRMTPGSPN